MVLLLFRAAAFVACASFTAAQIIKPIIDGGSRVSDFMNFHEWSFYFLTLFFFFATVTSLRGRGLHSFTSQLNLSRCGHTSPCPPV